MVYSYNEIQYSYENQHPITWIKLTVFSENSQTLKCVIQFYLYNIPKEVNLFVMTEIRIRLTWADIFSRKRYREASGVVVMFHILIWAVAMQVYSLRKYSSSWLLMCSFLYRYSVMEFPKRNKTSKLYLKKQMKITSTLKSEIFSQTLALASTTWKRTSPRWWAISGLRVKGHRFVDEM